MGSSWWFGVKEASPQRRAFNPWITGSCTRRSADHAARYPLAQTPMILSSSAFTMADLPNLLLASLEPSTRKQAEQNLNAISTQKGFLTHLLALVLERTQPASVRLAGSIYLKNIAKLRWEEVCGMALIRGSILRARRKCNLYQKMTRLPCDRNSCLLCSRCQTPPTRQSATRSQSLWHSSQNLTFRIDGVT